MGQSEEGEWAPQQVGCPLEDDIGARLLAPDELPCQAAPAQSSFLNLNNTKMFLTKQNRKYENKVLK